MDDEFRKRAFYFSAEAKRLRTLFEKRGVELDRIRRTIAEYLTDTSDGEKLAALTAIMAEPRECECCLGDPELVCDACGQHACWAGNFMCEDAYGAGVIRRDLYVEKDGAS